MIVKDLPQFTIEDLVEEPDGWVILGHFDRTDGIREGRAWLYRGGNTSIIGSFEWTAATAGRLRTHDRDRPRALGPGDTLPWLDGYWEAHTLAAVLAPAGQWQMTTLRSGDAFEHEAGGHRIWRKAEGEQKPGEHRVSGGWDHEHCCVCEAHIHDGDPGYRGPFDKWLCAECFTRYVVAKDISFVLE